MKKAGVPIYGIGIQGHFGSSNIDMTTLKVGKDNDGFFKTSNNTVREIDWFSFFQRT